MIGTLSRPLGGVQSFPVNTPIDLRALNDNFRHIVDGVDQLTGDLNTNAPSGFNVLGVGADNRGLSDSYTAFTRAIAAAKLVGGVVYVPEGTYVTSLMIRVPSGVTIQGAGMGATTVKRTGLSDSTTASEGAVFGTGSDASTNYTVGSHGSFVVFRDLTVDGNYAGNVGVTSTTPHCDGIRADYTDNLTIERVRVQNCYNSGTYLYGCRRSRHVNVVAYSNGHLAAASSRNGISITGPTDDATDQGAQDEHYVIGCELRSNTDEGVAFLRNGLVVIANCVVTANGDKGIEGDVGATTTDTTSVPSGVIISGCHIFNNGAEGVGVNNSNVQRVIIADCVIESHTQSGITTDFSSGSLLAVTGCIIRDFASAGSTHHGINVGDFATVVIEGNLIADGHASGGGGIVFQSTANARHVSVSGNVINGVAVSGIGATGKITGTISGNTITGATVRAMELTGGANGIANLDVVGNSLLASGVGLLIRTNGAGNVTGVRLFSNTITGNTTGLSLTESTGTITSFGLGHNAIIGNTGNVSGLTDAMVEVLPFRVGTNPDGSTAPFIIGGDGLFAHDSASVTLNLYSAAGTAIRMRRYGTSISGATALGAGATMGSLFGSAHDGAAGADGAAIVFQTSSAWGVGDHSANILFQTVDTSATTLATRWTLQRNGHWAPASNALYDFGLTGTRPRTVYSRYFASGINSPAQITTNQDNYVPGDYGWLRLTTDTSRNITGFTSGVEGRELTITNVGAFNIVLMEQITSTAANQIITGTGADITVAPLDTVMLKYDSVSSRWRVVTAY